MGIVASASVASSEGAKMKGEETKTLTEVSTEKPKGSQEMSNGWKTEDNNSLVTQQPKGQEAEKQAEGTAIGSGGGGDCCPYCPHVDCTFCVMGDDCGGCDCDCDACGACLNGCGECLLMSLGLCCPF